VSHCIAVLPGDGIGPEVTTEAVLVLRAVTHRFGHEFEFDHALIGGAAIDATGTPLPAATLAACSAADAILLGAVGGPRWDSPAARVRPEQGLLGLRKELELFANLRPVQPKAFLSAASPVRPEILRDVDLLVVRELTGGLYFGEQRRETTEAGERATDTCTYTAAEIERVVRIAATIARTRRGKVTSVDKANVLETSRLWRQVATRVVHDEFPDLELEHVLVDACAMLLISQPSRFDVIVTENLFGDILTDEAAVLVGSIGLLPSASLGARRNRTGWPVGLYEPIHGSAPSLVGKQLANPVGAILSAALLLRHSLGLEAEADAIERATTAVLEDGIRTADIAGQGSASGTAQVGAAVARRVASSPIAAHQGRNPAVNA
jgi:3-isopropylmalate dehydrogenase